MNNASPSAAAPCPHARLLRGLRTRAPSPGRSPLLTHPGDATSEARQSVCRVSDLPLLPCRLRPLPVVCRGAQRPPDTPARKISFRSGFNQIRSTKDELDDKWLCPPARRLALGCFEQPACPVQP